MGRAARWLWIVLAVLVLAAILGGIGYVLLLDAAMKDAFSLRMLPGPGELS